MSLTESAAEFVARMEADCFVQCAVLKIPNLSCRCLGTVFFFVALFKSWWTTCLACTIETSLVELWLQTVPRGLFVFCFSVWTCSWWCLKNQKNIAVFSACSCGMFFSTNKSYCWILFFSKAWVRREEKYRYALPSQWGIVAVSWTNKQAAQHGVLLIYDCHILAKCVRFSIVTMYVPRRSCQIPPAIQCLIVLAL